MSVVQRLKGER